MPGRPTDNALTGAIPRLATPRASVVQLAAFGALVFLQLLWARQPLPPLLKVLPFVLTGLSIWRPWFGLVAFALIAPLKGELWAALSGEVPADPVASWSAASVGTRLLEQMAVAVLIGATVRWRAGGPRLRLARPALLFSAVALTSAAAMLPARWLAASPDAGVLDILPRLWNGEDFSRLSAWRPMLFALYTIEGAALACVTEWIVRETPARAWTIVAALVAGITGVALASIATFFQIASRLTESVPELLNMLRVSCLTDFNATGSVLVMTIIAAVALVRRDLVRVVSVIAAIAVLLAGLWLTGARMAIVALAISLSVAGAIRWMAQASLRRWILVGTATVLMAATMIGPLFRPTYRSASLSFIGPTRWIAARAGLRMAMTAPLFGVGIGTFWDRSVEFGTDEMLPLARATRLAQTDAHENAHNNFIQVLAEEGLAGLLALCLVLAAVLVPAASRTVWSGRGLWIFAAVGGFVLTWLSGHPLLAPEAAFAFWLLFGVLAGLTPAPPSSTPSRGWLWIASVTLIISLPFRMVAESRIADFSHVGVGVSEWTKDAGGTEYRTAGSKFSLYIPANKLVAIPMRREPDAPPALRLEVRADDRLVNELVLRGTEWSDVAVTLPSKHVRFLRVDFTIRAEPPGTMAATVVQLGKDKSRE